MHSFTGLLETVVLFITISNAYYNTVPCSMLVTLMWTTVLIELGSVACYWWK